MLREIGRTTTLTFRCWSSNVHFQRQKVVCGFRCVLVVEIAMSYRMNQVDSQRSTPTHVLPVPEKLSDCLLVSAMGRFS